MKWKLIKTIRVRDLPPRPYLEIDEELNLRAGIEWVPQMDTALGVEVAHKLSSDQAETILPFYDRLRARGLVD
jgi:hypothetical protein